MRAPASVACCITASTSSRESTLWPSENSSALEACEAYFQAFQFVVWSGMDAQSAVDAVLFETVGEA